MAPDTFPQAELTVAEQQACLGQSKQARQTHRPTQSRTDLHTQSDPPAQP